MEDSIFAANRLRALKPRLEQRYQEARERERRAEYMRCYDELAHEAKALAKEIAETYRDCADRIGGLFGRVSTFRERCSELHRTAPPSTPRVRDPEMTARGLEDFGAGRRSLLDADDGVRLPSFTAGQPDIWPPRRQIDPAHFMLPVVASYDPRRHSDQWHEVFEEEQAARRQAELRRIEEETQHVLAAPGFHWWASNQHV